jgi:hypothetical protein
MRALPGVPRWSALGYLLKDAETIQSQPGLAESMTVIEILPARLYCCRMKSFVIRVALILLAPIAVIASQPEDRAADSVAAAFMQTRAAAQFSKLERIGRNPFREKVCRNDLRFASGLVLTAQYQTVEPSQLPERARELALHRDDGYRVTTRFGVGVCATGHDPSGPVVYSVLIRPTNRAGIAS